MGFCYGHYNLFYGYKLNLKIFVLKTSRQKVCNLVSYVIHKNFLKMYVLYRIYIGFSKRERRNLTVNNSHFVEATSVKLVVLPNRHGRIDKDQRRVFAN